MKGDDWRFSAKYDLLSDVDSEEKVCIGIIDNVSGDYVDDLNGAFRIIRTLEGEYRALIKENDFLEKLIDIVEEQEGMDIINFIDDTDLALELVCDDMLKGMDIEEMMNLWK